MEQGEGLRRKNEMHSRPFPGPLNSHAIIEDREPGFSFPPVPHVSPVSGFVCQTHALLQADKANELFRSMARIYRVGRTSDNELSLEQNRLVAGLRESNQA